MITPRRTCLLRTPHLRAFQRAIAEAAGHGDPAARRATAIIVPTRAAAEQLRRTLENLWLIETTPVKAGSAFVLPDLLTRTEWYAEMHARLPAVPPLATDLEREVLFRRAGRAAIDEGLRPPFALRPGLIVELLSFSDELARRQQSIEAFERLMLDALEPSLDFDRGAARLADQTRFLVAAFRAYERRLDDSCLIDEHGLRRRLLEDTTRPPLRHMIVTVGDEIADRRGLWPADFDLLARLPGLETVHIIATEAQLATGLHERLHHLLPGLTEDRFTTAETRAPTLMAPPRDTERLHHLSRDREEELADAVRRAKARARRSGGAALDRFAIVFQRPLPYVYLARQVFGASRVPYQAFDALPLAAEPYAAAVDLVFSAVVSRFTRSAIVALLRSPLLRFDLEGRPLTLQQVGVLDKVLQQIRFLGGDEGLARLAEALESGRHPLVRKDLGRAAGRAARVAADVAGELVSLGANGASSAHLATVAAFLRRHEHLPAGDDPWRERHLRARSAILGALEALGDAHAAYDDTSRPFAEVAATVRRWIETQTFSPRTGRHGVHLVDASAARYGDFDEVRLVGLVDTDWPEAIARTILYPAGLLAQLGWAREPDRRRGPRSAFHDLLMLAPERVSLSTFTLEDDALVRPSPFLEDLAEAGLAVEHEDARPSGRIFAHEALAEDPVAPEAVAGSAAVWLALRGRRPSGAAPEYHGTSDPREPAVYRVSYVERYVQCPFKYFADQVLHLEEEREEEPGLTPQERGLLLHEVLLQFFERWQASGRGAITAVNLDEALAEFARVAADRLASLPDVDAALVRAQLLGSAVATGMGSRTFEFEAGSGAAIVERLLEYPIAGEFSLWSSEGTRRVRMKGKVDRIDLLGDGTMRVLDYKLGRAPKAGQAIQLPVYGVSAEQQLSGHRGRHWRLGTAGYVAFGDDRTFVPVGRDDKAVAEAVREGQERFVKAVEGIEGGRYPVQPAEPFRCRFCAYPSVCRKDYVGDE